MSFHFYQLVIYSLYITGCILTKNITFSNKEGKFIAVEKEKKVMEEGVTRKKRNFIMFESKLGTERDRDMHKIGNVNRDVKPRERVEEKIIIKKKKKEYLDNYQYHETKQLSKAQPDLVIHKRWGDPVEVFLKKLHMKKLDQDKEGEVLINQEMLQDLFLNKIKLALF